MCMLNNELHFLNIFFWVLKSVLKALASSLFVNKLPLLYCRANARGVLRFWHVRQKTFVINIQLVFVPNIDILKLKTLPASITLNSTLNQDILVGCHVFFIVGIFAYRDICLFSSKQGPNQSICPNAANTSLCYHFSPNTLHSC